MAKSVGIDLGTTNSVAAVVKGALPTVIVNPQTPSYSGGQLLRSVVSLVGEDIIVGPDAYEFGLEGTPENTIRSIKRLMGRDFSDPNVQVMKARYPFKIVKPSQGTERSVAVIMGEKEYSPQEISALILAKLKEVAAEALEDGDISAVITVPAYFNDKQKDATRKAGWLAGLKVQRLLPEPTAAAISYGIDEVNPGEAKTILVYDLGGGTFDVSILLMAGGAFVERGKGGDMWLGGDDFDSRIADYVLQRTAEEYMINDLSGLIEKMTREKVNSFKFQLAKECEAAKHKLSALQKARIRIPAALRDEENNDIPIDVEITRAQFESLISSQIDKTIEIVQATLSESSMTINDIDKVLLVGGSTLIPFVPQRLSQEFGKDKVLRSAKPMLCVAEGAAILANRLGDKIECPQCAKEIVRDTERCSFCNCDLSKARILNVEVVGNSPHTYSLTVRGEEHEERIAFVRKGDPLPCDIEKSFLTSVENQRLVRLVWHDDTTDEEVGKLWISLPPNLPAGSKVFVRIQVDEKFEQPEVSLRIADRPGLMTKQRLTRGQTDEAAYLEFDGVIDKFSGNRVNLRNDEEAFFWTKAQDLVEAINAGDASRYNGIVMQLKNMLGQQVQETAWERNAERYVGYAEYLLQRYLGIITADQSYKYRQLIEELKETVLKRDKDKTQMLLNKVDEFEKTFDKSIDSLELVFRASRQISSLNPAKAAQLNKEGLAILSDLKGGKNDLAVERFNKVFPEVEKILQSMTGIGSEILLKKEA